ncbi:MAG: SpoIID/LytB domain-containing protein [Flavobacteriales bacterium]|nr:SpoIID/LytB domain-containing protein [Flavobacteriales bacterium]
MRFGFIFLLFASLAATTFAGGDLRIGLFQGKALEGVTIVSVKGDVWFVIDESEDIHLKPGESADVFATSAGINITIKGKVAMTCASLSLKPSKGSTYRIRPPEKKTNMRIYEDELQFYKRLNGVQLVLEIDLENYVGGVVEAESGKGKLIEYYKVQSVISRTYALNNLRRHEAEGFHLCDATHCQVYHGKNQFEPLIAKAIKATEDVVVVDSEIQMITATFHSNCGGHTVNSEEVWSKALSYLVGRPDTFCVKMPNSQWEKSIPSSDWNGYLKRKKQLAPDSVWVCISPNSRQYFPVDSTSLVPTKLIREDFKLKSSYFTVNNSGPDVRLMGRGFGHGVGLCQEGAMVMAGYGYTYKDIIHFYYKDVHLIPRTFIRFFADDGGS